MSLYDIYGNKIKSFADDGILEFTNLPDYINFTVSAQHDDIFIDYETGIRQEGESFNGTAHVLSKLGLEEYLEEVSEGNTDAFKIYPNPFSEFLTLENYGPKVKDIEIRIYDMLGQKAELIYLDEIRRDKISLELLGLASGMYLVQIVADGKVMQVEKNLVSLVKLIVI